MPHLQIIRRNARRLLKLINALLQFSYIESNQLKAHYREINIAKFTQELASEFKSMAKTLGLDYNIDIPNPEEFNHAIGDKIYLDYDMYETIVFNLCSNAFKHTWNGQIDILLYLDYKENKKMIVLEVSDTGIGIPEIALPNIFQRFYRAESKGARSHEGTGIGLALVKELITLHGGDIAVSSVVNQGSTFKCWFPIGCNHLLTNQIHSNNMQVQPSHDRELYTNRQLYLEESSQWIKNKEPETQDAIMDQFSTDNQNNDNNKILTENHKKYKVLIVDDNNDMRDYLADLLREFDIYRARDGQDAIRVLKMLKKSPDLILSDIMMPNMDGYELLDVLRSDIKTLMIPVILLLAKACDASKIKGSNAFKHTWNGQIDILLYLDYKENKKMIVLEVSDTGIGIPEIALPNIFQRFYRAESKGARSHEGTGIGLALVKELITLHGGDIAVSSVVNQGSTFKCWFPIGCNHLLTNQIHSNNMQVQPSHDRELYTNRQLYLEESSQWIKNKEPETQDAIMDQFSTDNQNNDNNKILTENHKKYKVLIVDDNNDMSFFILNAFLGLDKGADDYLVKPFSSRELVARIRANIELSLLRRKMFFHRYKQEDTKQLLFSITNMITGISKLDLNKVLLYVAREIYRRLPCERISIIPNEQSNNNKIVVPEGKDSEYLTPVINPFSEINDNNGNNSQIFTMLKDKSSGIGISLDIYCDDVRKNVSELSVEVNLDNGNWGWIKSHRSPNSIWSDSEIEFLQQISNQISMAVTYARLLKENIEKEIQIKAIEIANNAKSQILANTSHELRTPLGAIVGITSSFESNNLNNGQRDMLNIISNTSDIVLSIVNDILNVAKLETKKINLINRTFDLLELFENTIDIFGKKAGTKKIELILNCEADMLPKYVKSDPERIKYTNEGEIVLTISMQQREFIDETEENSTYSQMVKKEILFFELYDTGISIDIQRAWESFSQGDMSITKEQYDAGLGLSICKNLIEINGGEIKAESQVGKGNKCLFTWNVELLLSMIHLERVSHFNEQISYALPYAIRKKRILILHSVESVRNSLLKYLKKVEKVDAFDTFDKGIRAAKTYKELYQCTYDIVFISLYENNKEEVINAVSKLKGLEINSNNLTIIFIVFSSDEGIKLAEEFIEKVLGITFVIYAPITWNKIINHFKHIEI
ncbi:histidine kinase-like ATPase [Gigaspora rosea]|uniref:Histidine kinase-like ATPase n=1 Tax=Gigaspora rosea TaxID=44941 RepID=A0A397VDL1_9GLOM|nr:histidine kinase-like ATPase [Gigaspora rosea]